jgi:general stress protein YciG
MFHHEIDTCGGSMPTELRGFASMDADRQREIASKGGRAAHEKGTAHEWTREEARSAGRKGGRAKHEKSSGGRPSDFAEDTSSLEEPIADLSDT